ncbi:MAG TPA: XrtA system polysaccharide deacetylase [Gemmatimonadaceae bacterium]|nr:XrtA system polysaccharide deacetylase [Gemmatimonadaceae bacterium]
MPDQTRRPTHFFTVDVEEYFQVRALETAVDRSAWETLPRRLDRPMHILLDQLEAAGARGTFFTLGWVADRNPDIVRRIVKGGHELASHGYWHRRVADMTPAEFREDLRTSKVALENCGGVSVIGFRAPNFSIVEGCDWAFDILLEEGFQYDSSVFPIWRPGYGNPSAPRAPHRITRPAGTLAEFPLATTTVLGLRVPAAGGGYLRQFPFALIHRAFAEASARGVPATFYVHPWELDAEQPRFDVPLLTRVRHYRGLAATEGRIARLLRDFPFGTIASSLNDVVPASA